MGFIAGKQTVSMVVLALAGLAEDLAILVTCGFWEPGLRGWLLFSCPWFERLEKYDDLTCRAGIAQDIARFWNRRARGG